MSRLSPSVIASIKRLLWDGKSQMAIAADLGISQAAVSNIKRGVIGREVPWPSGQIGSMPPRSGIINQPEGNWSDRAVEYMAYPEDIRERMRTVVNEERYKKGEDPIPPISVEYEQYIKNPDPDNVADSQREVIARDAENRRQRAIMEEYQRILDVHRQRKRISMLKDDLDALVAMVPKLEELPDHNGGFVYNKLSLDAFKALCSSHPILLKAKKSKDPLLLEALLIVAYNWRKSPMTWVEVPFARQVQEVFAILTKYPEIVKRIKDEGLYESYFSSK